MRENVSSGEYFNWLLDKIGDESYRYSELLDRLFYTEFTYSILLDENRIDDGLNLRRDFMEETNSRLEHGYLYAPCSVLEVMVALAIRCEVHIMSNDDYGDRTATWFWEMIDSLGLGDMTDGRYDGAYVDDVINDFLDRNYEPDGRGSLFTLENPPRDMRTVEIWYQMCFYLNEYLEKH